MTRPTLEQSYLLLIEFLLRSKRRVVEAGAEFGLTGMQAMMLFLLDNPRPMHSFRTIFNCDASNITGLVDGLEQKRLAARFESEQDRRIKMVKLSAHGRRVRQQLLKRVISQANAPHTRLTAQEFQTFINLLRKITPAAGI